MENKETENGINKLFNTFENDEKGDRKIENHVSFFLHSNYVFVS